MESTEISIHEVRVYRTLKAATEWITSAAIAERSQVAPRTARHHALKLVRLGIVDQLAVSPGYRYRMSDRPWNRDYIDRLEEASVVFAND